MKNISKIIFLCFYRSRKEKSHYASCKCLKENSCQCCMSSIFTLKIDDHLLTCLRLLVQQTNRCKEETKVNWFSHPITENQIFFLLLLATVKHIKYLWTKKCHLPTMSRIFNRSYYRTRWSTWRYLNMSNDDI